jgi:hypothetical protein
MAITTLPRAELWADQIRIELGKTVESILETGRLLIKAKADLTHGEWGRMFDERLLPFCQETGRRYMLIARHPVISDSTHVWNLPSSWGTLYELTKIPEQNLKNALADGVITPDMQRSAVRGLMPQKTKEPVVETVTAPPPLSRECVAIEGATNGVIKRLPRKADAYKVSAAVTTLQGVAGVMAQIDAAGLAAHPEAGHWQRSIADVIGVLRTFNRQLPQIRKEVA